MEPAGCIDSPSFSTFEMDSNTLSTYATEILYTISKDLSITKGSIQKLISDIQSKYQDNPFHSFSHALTVTQMMYLFITKTTLSSVLSSKEKLSLLLCMLCHDLEHPGLSNGFQINSRSDLAKLYNNTSVLENHHLACALELLSTHDALFQSFSKEEKRDLFELLTTLILSTDLAKHFALIKDYEQAIANFHWDNHAHRVQLFIMLVKAADISNEARPFSVSKLWAHALMQEYFAQSEIEKKSSLPVTPFMDKEKVVIPQTQINFIETFLMPTFTLLHKVLPEMQVYIDVINTNKQEWAK
jgi:high affinity cGMP-specific 3',5'-cyclic phosphodiesterase 9